MAHIPIPEGIAGIRGPMMFRPETAAPLNQLAEILLRGPHSLSPDVTPKLKALLAIAAKVQQSGRQVTSGDVSRARELGATDLEIHDTVLIAAFFSLCNRYVDGLATWTPESPDFYRQRAAIVAEKGYAASAVTPSPVPQPGA